MLKARYARSHTRNLRCRRLMNRAQPHTNPLFQRLRPEAQQSKLCMHAAKTQAQEQQRAILTITCKKIFSDTNWNERGQSRSLSEACSSQKAQEYARDARGLPTSLEAPLLKHRWPPYPYGHLFRTEARARSFSAKPRKPKDAFDSKNPANAKTLVLICGICRKPCQKDTWHGFPKFDLNP